MSSMTKAQALRAGVPKELVKNAKKKPKSSGKKKEPNRTETAYSQLLQTRQLDGEIHSFGFEQDKLVLAEGIGGKVEYNPDFTVFRIVDGVMTKEYHEVKGPKVWDDAIVKYKVAAFLNPQNVFWWIVGKKTKTGYVFHESRAPSTKGEPIMVKRNPSTAPGLFAVSTRCAKCGVGVIAEQCRNIEGVGEVCNECWIDTLTESHRLKQEAADDADSVLPNDPAIHSVVSGILGNLATNLHPKGN